LSFDRPFVARNPLLVALDRGFVENRCVSGNPTAMMIAF
jgi:hypothetical protein